MDESLLRVWTPMNIEAVKKHLLLAGELSANCENCQQLGIDFNKEATCPNCHTPFKYISFRKKAHRGEELSAIKRLRAKRPDLIIIDYEDVKRTCGKSKAQNLFDL